MRAIDLTGGEPTIAIVYSSIRKARKWKPTRRKVSRAARDFPRKRSPRVEESKGAMPVPAMLRHKVRYFCDGAVLGTADFVNEVFTRERSRFGPNRETGARRMRGANWGELRVLRNLRENVVA